MNAASYYQQDDDLLRCLEDYIEGQRATITQLRATVRRLEAERLGCSVVARMVPHTSAGGLWRLVWPALPPLAGRLWC